MYVSSSSYLPPCVRHHFQASTWLPEGGMLPAPKKLVPLLCKAGEFWIEGQADGSREAQTSAYWTDRATLKGGAARAS
jgi:hypothetical protein